jgi:hypothetical protein
MLRAHGYEGKRTLLMRSALILAAEAALGAHDPADARRYADDARAAATLDSLTDSRSAYVGGARVVEARALLALGDTLAARHELERGVAALRAGAGEQHPRTREGEALLAALTR